MQKTMPSRAARILGETIRHARSAQYQGAGWDWMVVPIAMPDHFASEHPDEFIITQSTRPESCPGRIGGHRHC